MGGREERRAFGEMLCGRRMRLVRLGWGGGGGRGGGGGGGARAGGGAAGPPAPH